MTTLQIGMGAYRRASADMPEVRLENRFVERTPTNLREQVALIARPGTELLARFPPDESSGRIRGHYSELGVFNDDLFVVSGQNLYRYDGEARTQISGEVQGTEKPSVTLVRGAGYEHLFIADGLLLQYYAGGDSAMAVLTDDDEADYANAVIEINGAHYGWNSNVDAGDPDGSESDPFWCLPGGSTAEALSNMVDMLNFDGEPGVDFSSVLAGANSDVRAESDSDTLTLTARVGGAAGNEITVSVDGDGDLSWDDDTLTGGGAHILRGVNMPDGVGARHVASLNQYVWVGVSESQRHYYIRPGETEIDSLMFAEAEAGPDPVTDMVRLGDKMVLLGTSTTEFWSATGNADAPFAPTRGRAFARGIVEGTAVVVDEHTIVLVGNDGKVYAVRGSPQRISDHSIEERIRRQIRREAGLT